MFLSLYPCLFERVWQLFLQSSPELSRHHQQALCKDMNGGVVGRGVMLAEMQGSEVGWGSGRRVTHRVVLLVCAG